MATTPAGDRPDEPSLDRVGVRELRQNLSVYLRRVKAGETLVVTEHGREVGRLGPPPAIRSGQRGVFRQLLDAGVVLRATGGGAWRDQEPVDAGPGTPASDALAEQRSLEDR